MNMRQDSIISIFYLKLFSMRRGSKEVMAKSFSKFQSSIWSYFQCDMMTFYIGDEIKRYISIFYLKLFSMRHQITYLCRFEQNTFQSSIWSYFQCDKWKCSRLIVLSVIFQSSIWSYFQCDVYQNQMCSYRHDNFNLLFEAIFNATNKYD